MRAHHGSASDIDWRGDDLIRTRPLQKPARRHNVRHRVHRANFVEVDLADFPSVRARLRLGEQRVDVSRPARNIRRQRKRVDDLQHVVERAVLVMVVRAVVVPFTSLLVSVHENREMRRGDSAFRERPRLEDDAGNADRV